MLTEKNKKRTVICDLEANGLSPTEIHVIVCKDVDTGEVYVFKDNWDDFRRFRDTVGTWIGHNFLGFDRPALSKVLAVDIDAGACIDTLVLSRLTDATLGSHSLEAWGVRLGLPKLHTDITDWSKYTPEMEERCKGDVETNFLLYKHLYRFIESPIWKDAIETEHYIASLCHTLSQNGFAYNLSNSLELQKVILKELKGIDKELTEAFRPKVSLVREVLPRATKFGTIAKNSIPKVLGTDFTPYTADAPFSLIEYVPFNAGSPKQIVERLNEAGWSPRDKTKGHKEAEKALRALKRQRGWSPTREAEKDALRAKLEYYATYGWMISEANLATLPDTAPKAASTLVRRLLLASRASTLQTWIDACGEDGRIHGSFHHIGAWTHRMSHSDPNQGNIPKFDAKQPHKTPYSDKMRQLWMAGKDRLLIGVDAESIQLRIFGHYLNDEEFINALVSGRKEDGTDPHSVNQRALGKPCKSRDDSKTFIYAWLLGAGLAKVAAILGCSLEEAEEANDNFLKRYPGLAYLKEHVIPRDATRGYFEGFDGRLVKIWGDDYDSRRHFTLAGYLQNGEAVIMKRAVQLWYPKLVREKVPFWWVNFVHDEWQTETVNDMEIAKYVATTQADSIRQVGVDLGLRCPFAGSILNAHGKLAIGSNWMETH